MELKTNEVLNYLLAHKDLKIIQRRDMFNFSLDTVLLANFASITRDTHRIIDLGTNNAAIPLLLSKRTKVPVLGIEIQEEAAELLLEAQGFTDVVVNLTGESADVIVPQAYMEDASRAQIEDIVKRKTSVPVENIVITPLEEGTGTNE